MSIETEIQEFIREELDTYAPADVDEILTNDQIYGYGQGFEFDGAEYVIMLDDEADLAWDEALQSYLDECVLPELPDGNLRNYFDEEAWKRDAKHDGRGHALNHYDGSEYELHVDDVWYAVYRVN